MIKLIASDLDGTLLAKVKGGLTDYTADVLKQAISKGVKFVVATGRDYSTVRDMFEEKEVPFCAILGNGAQYVDEEGKLMKSAYFPKHRFKEVLSVLDQHDLPYMIFTDQGYYTCGEPEVVAREFYERGMVRFGRIDSYEEFRKRKQPCNYLVKIDDVDAFLKRDLNIIKIESFYKEENRVIEAKKELVGIEDIAYLSSFVDNVEVTSQYAQKGLILESVIADLGIKKEEVAVFGDGMNDITLFRSFENSYATANGVEEIKAMAKEVIPSCEDEGVAKKVIELVLND